MMSDTGAVAYPTSGDSERLVAFRGHLVFWVAMIVTAVVVDGGYRNVYLRAQTAGVIPD